MVVSFVDKRREELSACLRFLLHNMAVDRQDHGYIGMSIYGSDMVSSRHVWNGLHSARVPHGRLLYQLRMSCGELKFLYI